MTDKYTNRNDSFGNLPDGLRVNPFAVPDRYFEDLAKRSLLRNKLRQEMDDASAVPDGYFDNLQADILTRLRTEKLSERVSEPGMTVPEGYFDGLSAKLLAATAGTEDATPATAETPVRQLRTRQWLPYVAASILALAVAVTAYLGINPPESNNIAGNLQAVPAQEIISYLELYGEADYLIYQSGYDGNIGEWLDEEFSEADIEAYFNNTL